MKDMSKFNFKSLKPGTIRIEIQSLIPERFINLLWKNNVHAKNLIRLNVTTVIMEVSLRDYRIIEEAAKKSGTKIKIVERKGMAFFALRIRRQSTLVGGIVIFLALLYYLSTFIWGIDIQTDKYLSPYEIRQILFSYGVRPGIPKNKLNVYALQDKVTENHDDIMWFRARIEGSRLKISLVERVIPPEIAQPEENEPANIVSKVDGEIVRVFTTAGTAVVKPGDVVKHGEILVKGEQGKDGSVYQVHAKGEVIAKTFYEVVREVPLKGVKDERTGRKVENLYLSILGKKIYIKKTLDIFSQYDKIESTRFLINKDMFYEVKKKEFILDKESVIQSTLENMEKKTMEGLNKSVKLRDKLVETEAVGDNIRITVVFVIEQDIGVAQKVQ
jgi:similar to stage IV sporulation protein